MRTPRSNDYWCQYQSWKWRVILELLKNKGTSKKNRRRNKDNDTKGSYKHRHRFNEFF